MEVIKESINNNENVFIFVPRKGMSPNMVCADCGNLAVSPHSGLPYSLYTQLNKKTGKKENVYVCNASGEKIKAFDVCQFCKGTNLKKMGIATSGLADLLEKELPKKVDIHVIDAQHSNTKKAQAQLLKSHRKDSGSIFVGTTKALSVLPDWDRAIIVTLAPLLSRMSYRNEEDIVYLLAKIQEKTLTCMYLQDRKDIAAQLPVLKSGVHRDFITRELKTRKDFTYPPFQTLIELSMVASKEKLGLVYQNWLKRFEKYDPSVMLKPHSKSKGVIQTIIKLDPRQWSVDSQLEALKQELQNSDRGIKIRINPKNFS
jgi:primosomal protein N'